MTGTMVYRNTWEEEDIGEKLAATQLTVREFKRTLEPVHPELKFEIETAEDFDG